MQNTDSKNYPYELARIVKGSRYYVVYKKVYSIEKGQLVRKRKYFDNIKNEYAREDAAVKFKNETNKLLSTGNAYLKSETRSTGEKESSS